MAKKNQALVEEQYFGERFALYNGDCVEGMKALPAESAHFSVYSPPFGGVYNYSSSPNDLSNCRTYGDFFRHFEYVVEQIERITPPGRLSAVHCCDVPGNAISFGDTEDASIYRGGLVDLPGDIIRLHQKLGFKFHARFCIWKEPLTVAIRTRSKGLMHRQLVKDSAECNNAGADYVLVFRKKGENKIPIAHPEGLLHYAGAREIPKGLREKFLDWKDPKTNKLAHWIWQQYASSFWDDIRVGRVLPYKPARDKEDEKHVHPLQLDVIERLITLYSNPSEVVHTPFMGVGSEAYGAVQLGRRAIGHELKKTYFTQACKNVPCALQPRSIESGFEFNEESPAPETDHE